MSDPSYGFEWKHEWNIWIKHEWNEKNIDPLYEFLPAVVEWYCTYKWVISDECDSWGWRKTNIKNILIRQIVFIVIFVFICVTCKFITISSLYLFVLSLYFHITIFPCHAYEDEYHYTFKGFGYAWRRWLYFERGWGMSDEYDYICEGLVYVWQIWLYLSCHTY